MSDLINKLKKAMELKLPKRQSFDKGCLVDVGAAAENARLRPLLDALIEFLPHALECNETFHRLGGLDDCEPCKMRLRLEKLVSEGDVP